MRFKVTLWSGILITPLLWLAVSIFLMWLTWQGEWLLDYPENYSELRELFIFMCILAAILTAAGWGVYLGFRKKENSRNS
jgi:hypothetical protein